MLKRSLLLAFVAVSAFAAQPDMDQALAQMEGRPEEVKSGITFFVKNSERVPTLYLYFGAATAQRFEWVEDAAFLFYAAQLRARMDLVRYPPKGKGGDSAQVLIAAFNQEVGRFINPVIMRVTGQLIC